MTKNEDPNAPVTRFTSVNVVPDNENLMAGDFFGFPQLTQAQIDAIPEENLLPGIVVYNLDFNVYMAYFVNEEDEFLNRWMNLNTSLTYKGSGFQFGSPFALPAGPAAIVENDDQNKAQGAIYIDTTHDAVQARIYLSPEQGGWATLATSGGGGDTFTNITVTDTTTTSNLIVSGETSLFNLVVLGGVSTFTGEIDVEALGATTIITDTIDVNGITLSNSGGDLAINNSLVVEGNLNVNVNTDLDGYTTMFGGTTATFIQIGGANVELGSKGHFFATVGTGNAAQFTYVLGTDAGTGASATLLGSLLSGVFTLTTGSSPTSGGIIATFSLSNDYYYDAPFGVIVTAANSVAASMTTSVYAYVSALATAEPAQFILATSTGLPLTASTTYAWNYQIISNTSSVG